MLASHYELYAISSPLSSPQRERRVSGEGEEGGVVATMIHKVPYPLSPPSSHPHRREGEEVVRKNSNNNAALLDYSSINESDLHAMYNGTSAHPYMPPSMHDVDALEYATIRLETLQTIQVAAYNQLRKAEDQEFRVSIDYPFASIKDDERWLTITRWRERVGALLAQCEGEKSGSIVTIDASASYDRWDAQEEVAMVRRAAADSQQRQSSSMATISPLSYLTTSPSPSPSSPVATDQHRVFTIGVQEEDDRVDIYRQWVAEYRGVVPLQKRFLKMRREEADAAYKEEQQRRAREVWLESVILDHVNSQEAIQREEARLRSIIQTRGSVYLRRLCNQSDVGSSLIQTELNWEPSMRKAIVYAEALTRSQHDTSTGVLTSLATLKATQHQQPSSHHSLLASHHVLNQFDLRSKLWADGAGGDVSSAIDRLVGEESMERGFALVEEACQRQYELQIVHRDLQFIMWVAAGRRRVGDGVHEEDDEYPRKHWLPPLAEPPASQPL